MATSSIPKILIVEDDRRIRAMMVLSIGESVNAQLLESESAKDAIALIKSNPDIRLVISDYRLSGDHAGLIIEFLEAYPNIGFILVSGQDLYMLPEFSGRYLTGYFKKPFDPEALIAQVKSFLGDMGAPAALADPADAFSKISVDNLAKLGALGMDLYVKLSEQKFVKMAKEGDQFTLDDAAKFKAKGVEHLYLKKEDAQTLVKELVKTIKKMPASETLGFEIGYEVSKSALELAQQVALKFGMTPEVQKLTEACVEQVLKTVMNNRTLLRLFKGLCAEPGNYIVDHSVLLAHICCGIAATQSWTTQVTFEQLAYASLLHDILIERPEIARIQDYDKFQRSEFQDSKDARESLFNHSLDTAAMIRSVSGIPPEVETLISQHHERPDGHGFPRGLDYSSLRPLSCVFILGHELVTYLSEGGTLEGIGAHLKELQTRYERGHFLDVLSSLEGTLISQIKDQL